MVSVLVWRQRDRSPDVLETRFGTAQEAHAYLATALRW